MNRMHNHIQNLENHIHNRIQNIDNQLQNLLPEELNYLVKVLGLKIFLEDNGIKFHIRSYSFDFEEYAFWVNDGEIVIKIDSNNGNYIISKTYEEDIIVDDKILVKAFIDNNSNN